MSLSVLLTHSSLVPGTASYTGSPRSRIISAGVVLTNTTGACAAVKVFPGTADFNFLPVLVRRQLAETRRQLGGRRPGAVHGRGGHPAVVHAKKIRFGRTVLEQVPVRVHSEPEIVGRNRAPDGIAVDVYEHRRLGVEEHRRRIGLYVRHVTRSDLAGIDAGEHAIEGDDALVLRNGIRDFVDDASQLLFRNCRKVSFADRELAEAHQTFGHRDFRLRFDLDRPERWGLRAFGSDTTPPSTAVMCV